MERLLEKLPFVFIFGAAFAVMLAGMAAGGWLLVKLAKALRRLALSPEERQKQAAAARHPFAGVSLRGKEAWLVCCLEEALVACGLDAEQGEPGSWYPLLALLWKFPELPEEFIEDWLDETADILPSSVLSCDPGGPGELSQGEKERSAAACALYATARARIKWPSISRSRAASSPMVRRSNRDRRSSSVQGGIVFNSSRYR